MATWDKTQPAGTLKVREVDDYIRANNDALEDALSRGHTFPGVYGSTAGNHVLGGTGVLKVETKANLGTGTGVVGAMSYATDEEMLYRDTGTALSSMSSIPSGRKIYFYENTAPPGYTIDGAVADKVLAVKGGSNAYNAAGQTLAGTWTQPGHIHAFTLAAPAHTHPVGLEAHVHTIPKATGWSEYGAKYSGFSYTSDAANLSNYSTSSTGSDTNTGAASATALTGSITAAATATTYRPYAALGIICTRE